MLLSELQRHLDQLFEVEKFKDYCPNGLQVEGRAAVHKVLCGVTASQQLLDHAVACGADAIFVHHGWFWRGEDGRVTGLRKRRLATLLRHDISLFAYHLPLDAHPELGNNAQLGKLFGWQGRAAFGDDSLGWLAELPVPQSVAALAAHVGECLQRTPLLLGDETREVRRVAWCSGGAQGWFEDAIAAGAELFLTGEVSEPCTHLARESGVAYLAAGHHATERYGARAVAGWLRERHGLAAEFVDFDNPV